MNTNRKVRNLREGEEQKHFEMLNLCFNTWGSKEKWRSLYRRPSFDVTQDVIVVEENGEWIGGGTAWFREVFLRENKKVNVYIAGDGYVHPSHRGKGVYSTFMRSLNELARKRGACLGFGFVSVYRVPFVALPKYGFVDIFYPETKILVVDPKNFFHFVTRQIQDVNFPKTLEGIKLKLVILSNSVKGKFEASKIFEIRKGKLCELTDTAIEKIDLLINTDISLLLEIFGHFSLRRKILLPTLFISLLRRRLKIRFSTKFLKATVRLLIDRRILKS